jgi:hypothetical protein
LQGYTNKCEDAGVYNKNAMLQEYKNVAGVYDNYKDAGG